MSNIMQVASKLFGAITYPTRGGLSNAFHKNPEKAVALATVASVVVKDGIGCYKYVTQSKKNERIPEDKRKFVAALDLTNGVLMILAQILLFFAMRKVSEPLFNKLFKGTFGKEAIDNNVTRIRMIENKTGHYVDSKLPIIKATEKERKASLDVFKFVAELAAATIVGKRIVVPLIATPLANVVQKKMEDNETKKKGQVATQDVVVPEKQSEHLDVSTDDLDLQNRYKKYYGAIKKDDNNAPVKTKDIAQA